MADGLVAALARCQAKFPAIVKSHTNPAFKGSQYADVADVLAAVRPVLAAEGIVVTQATRVGVEGGVVLETSLLLEADPTEAIDSQFPLYVAGLTAQQVGSLMTYHRRYQLCALLGVHPVGDDDDGNLAATAQSAPQPRSEPATVTPDMSKPLASMSIAELRGAAKEMGHDFGNGAITKAEMIRQLEPLVKALTGEEPFETDAPPIPYVEEPTKPFEPVVANPAAFVRRDDELRNLKPDVRKSVIRGNE